MRNKINLGIIGKKFGYNVIYKAFLKNKKFNIVGFSYKSKKNEEINVPKNIKIYPNWKKLILDKRIKAIAVATPPQLNKKIIKFAIKNNKHIFCEKPFTCNYREATDICKLVKRRNISHMVNYEFPEIGAFNFFKKKIVNKIKITKVNLNWFIFLKKRPSTNWKEHHSKGGGIMFNFVCHAIYYLELLFGKIRSTKSKISIKESKKIKTVDSIIYFESGLTAKLVIKIGELNKKIKPIHQIKILSNKGNYILKTELDSLNDKFELNKFNKTLFKNKFDNNDFRIDPTFQNSKKFSTWILNRKKQIPNFFNAQRIHFIINKMLISSKKKSEVFID